MRQVASLLAGAAVGALGGLVLGEYPFTGWTPYVAGVLFALVVTEVMLTISRTHGPVLGIGGGVFSAGGLGWAVWISSGRGIDPIPGGGWIAIALGFAVAMVRGFLPNRRTAPVPPAPDEADAASPLDLLDEFIAPPGSATIVGSPTVRILEREQPRPEPSPAPFGGLPAPGDSGASTAGDATPQGEQAPAAEGPSDPRAKTTPKPPAKAASKRTSKAGSKSPSKAGSGTASRAAAKAGSTAGARAASKSAKNAPAKAGAKSSGRGGRSIPSGATSQKAAKKPPAAGGKVPTKAAVKKAAVKKAAVKKAAVKKAAVKRAEPPVPRSRRAGQ